jgi:hypothetical protein
LSKESVLQNILLYFLPIYHLQGKSITRKENKSWGRTHTKTKQKKKTKHVHIQKKRNENKWTELFFTSKINQSEKSKAGDTSKMTCQLLCPSARTENSI